MDGHDVLLGIGAALLGGGLWWVYPPLAAIVMGVLFMALAVIGARNKGRNELSE